jgi:HlyD family secretion protein
VRQIREGPITVQNVVTYDVVVDVDNSDLALFPGMTADAHIITAERTNVLRVPLPAIRFTPEGVGRQPGGEHRTAPKGDSAGRAGGTEQRPRRQGRRGAPTARVWVLRDGKLAPVNVQTGLDDGTLVEVSSDELRVGDLVVVNAVRPDDSQPLTTNANRAPGANAAPRGGGGFRL